MREYSFRQTSIYKKAFKQAMEIFELSKSFPKEEVYSLTDQIRRSSRSVCVNYAEGHRKRRYPAHFISKLSDCDMENTETLVWLDFANACAYLRGETYAYHLELNPNSALDFIRMNIWQNSWHCSEILSRKCSLSYSEDIKLRTMTNMKTDFHIVHF